MIYSLVTIFIVYLIYFFFTVIKFDRSGKIKKKGNKVDENVIYMALPSEAKYFFKKYKLDIKRVNVRGFLKLIGLILGVDIAIVSIVVLSIFKNVILQIIVATVMLIPIYLISLKILAKYFKKKGLIDNV